MAGGGVPCTSHAARSARSLAYSFRATTEKFEHYFSLRSPRIESFRSASVLRPTRLFMRHCRLPTQTHTHTHIHITYVCMVCIYIHAYACRWTGYQLRSALIYTSTWPLHKVRLRWGIFPICVYRSQLGARCHCCCCYCFAAVAAATFLAISLAWRVWLNLVSNRQTARAYAFF